MLIVAGGVVALTALVALAQSTCSSVQRSVEDPAFGLNSALDAEGLPTMTPENAARLFLDTALRDLSEESTFSFTLERQGRRFEGARDSRGVLYALSDQGGELLIRPDPESPMLSRIGPDSEWQAVGADASILPFDPRLLSQGPDALLDNVHSLDTAGNLLNDLDATQFRDYHMIVQGLISPSFLYGDELEGHEPLAFGLALHWANATATLDRVALVLQHNEVDATHFGNADTVVTLFDFGNARDLPYPPTPTAIPTPTPLPTPSPESLSTSSPVPQPTLTPRPNLPGWHSISGLGGDAMIAAPRTWLLFEVSGTAEYLAYLTADDARAIREFHATNASKLTARLEALQALAFKDARDRQGLYGVALTVNTESLGWTAFHLRRLATDNGVISDSAIHRKRIARIYGSSGIDVHPTLLGDLPAVRFRYTTAAVPDTVPSLTRVDWLIDSDSGAWLLSAHLPLAESPDQMADLERIVRTLILH